jgi:putative transposase
MKRTLVVKLMPDPNQRAVLVRTLETFNAACNAIAGVAFAHRCANKVALQQLVYRAVRQRFGLSAQMAIRAIAKVVEAYKRDTSIKPTFRSQGAMPYDERILSWKGVERVSLLTLDGRILLPVRFGDYQAARVDRIRGQADLVYRDGMFFLHVTVEALEPTPNEPTGYLGVDLGITNIAADSDGDTYSGGQLNGLRKRHARLRARLHRKGTRSAKRLLKKRRRKERRFATNVNHRISKQLVAKAKGTGRGIALEDLTGIRGRLNGSKAQRRSQHSWAFAQLRSFIEYKARLAGVLVALVDPRNTSRTCPACGCIDRRNRPTQARFSCVSCGFAGPADTIAAGIIARRADVMQPHAATGLAS